MDVVNQKTHEFRSFCRDCCFQISNDKGQTGCNADRLDKFKALDKVKLADDGFYEIQTICNLLRSTEWIEKINEWPDPVSRAKKEVELKVSFIVLAHKTDDDTLIRTLKKLVYQTIRPVKIVVMRFCQSYLNQNSPIMHLLTKVGIKYEIINVLDKDELGYLMDAGFKKSAGQYIVFVDGSRSIPLDYIEKLNSFINDDLKQISMVDADYHGLTVHAPLYKLLNGNIVESIQKKIKDLAVEQSKENMVISYKDLI
jgi:hypothetical protein